MKLAQELTDVTSKGKINIIRNEKYHATNTDRVTMMWCLNQSP